MDRKKKIILYIGKRRKFPQNGWIHPCYLCEAPTSEYCCKEYRKYNIEIYICNRCYKDDHLMDFIYRTFGYI